jgi:E3 ubiquitin-protein ligase RNF144
VGCRDSESPQTIERILIPDSLDTTSLNHAMSSTYLGSSKRKKEKEIECISCSTFYPPNDVAKAECEHYYCHLCATKMFETSLTDINHFPVTCCQKEISPDIFPEFLTLKLIEKYQQRRIEYENRNNKYCADFTCKQLLSKSDIYRDIGTCPKCQRQTCLICNKRRHENRDCPEDEGEDRF